MYKEIYVENDGHCGQRIVNEYCDPVIKQDIVFISEYSRDGKFLGMRRVRERGKQ
jgi:hypothetical protein